MMDFGYRRQLKAALAVLSAVGLGCSGSDVDNATDSSATTVSTTLPTTTATPTTTTSTTATTSTTSIAVEIVERESDPTLLAGARVLCTFNGAVVAESVLGRIRAGEAAGVLLFRGNLVSQEQAIANAMAIQAAAAVSPGGIAALIAVDQEGGIVKRIPGPPAGSAAEMGAWPTTEIETEGHATADLLRAWGINLDLAPVADVVRSATFVEDQGRSFSSDPEIAGAAVAAFVAGLNAGDVLATLKHFPGLGASTKNTDDSSSAVTVPADELNSVDLVPFAAGIAAGADLVMMSSAIYPAYDSLPAVLSPNVIRSVLRGELGFTGVVISDALDTPALASFGSVGEIAVTAASAGVDLFIGSDTSTCADVHESIAEALTDGTLGLESAQDAYERLEKLRTTTLGHASQDE